METRLINRDLQIKVLKYLDFIQDKDEEDPQKGKVIIDTLSKSLREEIYRNYYGTILMKNSFFRRYFSKEFI
jgi:hypothetical protein